MDIKQARNRYLKAMYRAYQIGIVKDAKEFALVFNIAADRIIKAIGLDVSDDEARRVWLDENVDDILDEINLRCPSCDHGVYRIGPKGSMMAREFECVRCQGEGRQTIADVHRNAVYDMTGRHQAAML